MPSISYTIINQQNVNIGLPTGQSDKDIFSIESPIPKLL